MRCNELCDGVVELSVKSFTPTCVRNDPLIFAGWAVKRPNSKPARSKAEDKSSTPQLEATEQKGNLLIHDIWHNGTNSVLDMRVMNTDARNHLAKKPGKCLQLKEQLNKKMYLEECLQKCQHFSPLVASVDGILSVEGSATLKSIASCLATKW